jgi:sulfate transport system permease protein
MPTAIQRSRWPRSRISAAGRQRRKDSSQTAACSTASTPTVNDRGLFALAQRSALPGFAPTLGVTLLWLGLIVLIPLAALAARPWELGISGFWASMTHPRVLAALRLSFGASLVAALINLPLGLLIAWVMVRYRFPLRRFADALIDMPLALPTAVAGIALTALFGPRGWVGSLLAPLGISLAYNPGGIVVAMVFVGLPFAVRTVEPVVMDLPRDAEEAAATLGATRAQTMRRVVIPALAPALLSGFCAALARAVGEYGSVIFIAGNMPMRSEIAPLLIVIRLEAFDYAGAAALGLSLLVLSFALLFGLGLAQRALRPATAP